MSSVTNTIFPVFLTVGLGYFVALWNDSISNSSKGLITFIFWVAVPSMLFSKIANATLPSEVPWSFLLSFYIPSVIVFFGGVVLARFFFRWQLIELGIAGVTSCYGNLALLGLPIVVNSFDEEFLMPALILIASQSAILFGLTIFCLEKSIDGGGNRRFVQLFMNKVIQNPIVLSLILGFFLNVSGMSLPAVLNASLNFLNAAAPGCSLFALGVCLAGYRVTFNDRSVLGFVLLRNFLHPLLVFGFCLGLGVSSHWMVVAILFAAMPTGINAFIFAEQYGLKQEIVSMTVIFSTIVSVMTLTILLHVFKTI